MTNKEIKKNLSQRLATLIVNLSYLERIAKKWQLNQQNSQLKLSKVEKVLVGSYLILLHYSQGIFPPTFDDQQKVYENEKKYRESMPGVSLEQALDSVRRKPFWFKARDYQFLRDFIRIAKYLEQLDITPPMKILELGCGGGWLSEFLAIMNFDVIGSTLASVDVAEGKRRIQALKTKEIPAKLDYIESPMESVDKCLPKQAVGKFDCVLVYEALHHAYSWEDTIEAAHRCLASNGILFICREPNLIHTLSSYRISILTNTHEIGFDKKKLVQKLKRTGFQRITDFNGKFGFGIRPIWLAARK